MGIMTEPPAPLWCTDAPVASWAICAGSCSKSADRSLNYLLNASWPRWRAPIVRSLPFGTNFIAPPLTFSLLLLLWRARGAIVGVYEDVVLLVLTAPLPGGVGVLVERKAIFER